MLRLSLSVFGGRLPLQGPVIDLRSKFALITCLAGMLSLLFTNLADMNFPLFVALLVLPWAASACAAFPGGCLSVSVSVSCVFSHCLRGLCRARALHIGLRVFYFAAMLRSLELSPWRALPRQ